MHLLHFCIIGLTIDNIYIHCIKIRKSVQKYIKNFHQASYPQVTNNIVCICISVCICMLMYLCVFMYVYDYVSICVYVCVFEG